MKKVAIAIVSIVLLFFVYKLFFSDKKETNILIFSKTAGVRHESIPAGQQAIFKLAKENGWKADTTEDASKFNESNLQNYNVIIFLSTTGDVLDDAQQLELNRWIQAGGGYVGIHAAADTEYEWPWYNDLVGAYFESHPNNPNVREATITRIDSSHIASAHLPRTWTRTDEWYNYKSIKSSINVLLKMDETSYEGGTNGDNHPIAWYQEFDGGRMFYTGLGHTDETFTEPLFVEHLKGGIEYAAGPGIPVNYNNSNVAPEENRFRKVVLDFNLNEPMELDLLPNGDILFIERHGDLKIFKKSGTKSETITTLEVFDDLEDGLLGMAIDPDFASNKWIYLYYSLPGDLHVQNLSRFEFINDGLIMDSEKILLQVPTQRVECCHSGGSIEFGPNGNLFLSIGDNTNPFGSDGYAPINETADSSAWDAQRSSGNANDFRGAILRITPEADGTYSIPDGNLFAKDGSEGKPEIYIMGNRNPFRIAIDQRTGYLYWGEVGPDAGKDSLDRGPMGHDEVNQARVAGNFGWPHFIGNNKPYNDYNFATQESGPEYDPNAPVNDSPNNTGIQNLPPAQPAFIWYPYGESKEFPLVGTGGRNAMAGPTFYYDEYPDSEIKYPKYYDGKLFIYDWMRRWIMAVTMDEDYNYKRMERFLPSLDLANPMDMVLSPQGDLYMLEYGTNWSSQNMDARLIHIQYTSSNRQPLSTITIDKNIGGIPMEVHLSGANSIDFDGDSLTYQWFVGENKIGTSLEINYTFEDAGEYEIKLIVSDPDNESHESTISIVAGNELPIVSWSLTGNNQFYFENNEISYKVTVTDKEDGEIGNGIDQDAVYVSVDFLAQGMDITESAQGHESLKERSAFIVGKAMIDNSDCKSCHRVDQASVGPTYKQIAAKYTGNVERDSKLLASKIINGGGGVWGDVAMAAHPQLTEQQARQMVKYILSIDQSNVQTGLPLEGTITLDKHKKGQTEGSYILIATYTDQGANGLDPLTQRGIKTLSYPIIWAKDFSEGENTMLYNVVAEDVPGVEEDVTILVGMHETIVSYNDIDFTDVSTIIIRAAVIPQMTAGGKINLRFDDISSDIFGTAVAETSITQLGMRDIIIPVPEVSGLHTLILEVISDDSEKPFGAIMNIELSNK